MSGNALKIRPLHTRGFTGNKILPQGTVNATSSDVNFDLLDPNDYDVDWDVDPATGDIIEKKTVKAGVKIPTSALNPGGCPKKISFKMHNLVYLNQLLI